MLKNEMKAMLTLMGAVFVPMVAQADQSMDSNQPKQMYVPGEIVKEGQLPAGYSASSTYQCMDGWDVFVTADYIYWAWQQDSFEVGTFTPTALTGTGKTQESVFQNPGYASGFQVGLGLNMPGMDDWNLYSEYTWYKNSDTTTVSNDSTHVFRPAATIASLSGAFFLNGSATSEIKMSFDALDFLLKRPFYFGKKLTANFGAGLKALWITQNFDSTVDGLFGLTSGTVRTAFNGSDSREQTSWGLGPKFGIDTNWMLGYGFQIMANLSTSVLYSRYNVSSSSSGTVGGVASSMSSTELDNYNTLKPVTEAFLGLGWNTGFYDNAYRIAFSVGYDFDVYWNYNLQKYAVSGLMGSMYLQGLNIQARFDF